MFSFFSFCRLINTKKTSKSKANPTKKEKKESSIGFIRVFNDGGFQQIKQPSQALNR
jgi:predicted neuraminidase